jgi:hypothetical protein
MKKQINIKAGTSVVLAELDDTLTAEAIWKALPLTSSASTWGEEIYFAIPVKVQQEQGKEVVNLGDLGYWPPGSAFCIFFGATPVSGKGEIRAASAVNVFGKIVGDPKVFKRVKHGQNITVEKA